MINVYMLDQRKRAKVCKWCSQFTYNCICTPTSRLQQIKVNNAKVVSKLEHELVQGVLV